MNWNKIKLNKKNFNYNPFSIDYSEKYQIYFTPKYSWDIPDYYYYKFRNDNPDFWRILSKYQSVPRNGSIQVCDASIRRRALFSFADTQTLYGVFYFSVSFLLLFPPASVLLVHCRRISPKMNGRASSNLSSVSIKAQ